MLWNVRFYCAESESEFTVLFQVSHKPTPEEVQKYIDEEKYDGVVCDHIFDNPVVPFKLS